MTSVFISYCRRNSYIAHQLNADLRRAGCTTFFDQNDIAMSDEWRQKIQAAVRQHDYFLYLWSPEAEASDVVQEEYRLAKEVRQPNQIGVARVAGSHTSMREDLQTLHHEDLSRDYWSNLPKVLNRLGVAPAAVSSPLQSIRNGLSVEDVVQNVPLALRKSWTVDNHTYLSFPVAMNGYSICRRVVRQGDRLELPNDVHVVLQFTGKGRDTVEQVLAYLSATGKTPSILYIEGPKKNGSYDLPTKADEQHVWQECIDFVHDCVEKFSQGRCRHFFFDAPQALVFPVGAGLHVRASYVMYNYNFSGGAAERYMEVYRK